MSEPVNLLAKLSSLLFFEDDMNMHSSVSVCGTIWILDRRLPCMSSDMYVCNVYTRMPVGRLNVFVLDSCLLACICVLFKVNSNYQWGTSVNQIEQ